MNISPVGVLSASPVDEPLSRKTIYKEIAKRICQVVTEQGKATGVCLGGRRIAVPAHILSFEKVSQFEGRYIGRSIQCIYKEIEYSAKALMSIDHSNTLDCITYEIADENFPELPDVEIFEGEIEVGEEIFYGGFPLTQTVATFHQGTVSSVQGSKQVEFCHFTIDGTVVPGNSGSPLFAVVEKTLKLAGILFHQVADFSVEDRQTIRIMELLRRSPTGLVCTITDETPQGPQQMKISFSQVVALSFDLIQKNLSTGIGRAFHARHLKELLNGAPIPPTPPSLRMMGMIVERKDQLPKRYKAKDGREYFTHSDGHQGKHLEYSKIKLKPRDLTRHTRNNPATFNQYAHSNYIHLLEAAIIAWADAGGPTPSYHTFSFDVGADEGQLTKSVEIYYGDSLGSHMRPKYIPKNESLR